MGLGEVVGGEGTIDLLESGTWLTLRTRKHFQKWKLFVIYKSRTHNIFQEMKLHLKTENKN